MYLDNAATTPLSDEVKEYIISLLDMYGNPSSHHSVGDTSKQIIEQSRKNIAKFINADAKNIIFTSGGSASNTLAIKGCTEKYKCILFYSPLLHKSALKCIESLDILKEPLKVNKYGEIDIDFFEKKMNPMKYPPFVVIEHTNSEIGTIQNIQKIIDITHKWDGIAYLDCTGSIPQIPIDVKRLDIDMIGFSGHKLGALKGCGVLYKKSNIELEPLIYGSQEMGLVGGTENVLGIASLGKAVKNYNYSSVSSANRDYVYNYIMNNIPDSYLVGVPLGENRLPHNLYMCFKGISAESLMILLDMSNIQVSTGSACSSGDLLPSQTLVAIGMNEEDIHSCVRFSFSGVETKEELDCVCEKLKESVNRLRNLNN